MSPISPKRRRPAVMATHRSLACRLSNVGRRAQAGSTRVKDPAGGGDGGRGRGQKARRREKTSAVRFRVKQSFHGHGHLPYPDVLLPALLSRRTCQWEILPSVGQAAMLVEKRQSFPPPSPAALCSGSPVPTWVAVGRYGIASRHGLERVAVVFEGESLHSKGIKGRTRSARTIRLLSSRSLTHFVGETPTFFRLAL